MWFIHQALLGLVFLVSMNSAKQPACFSHQDCEARFNIFYKCDRGVCIREDFQYRPIEIAGDVLIFLISALANAGGVGGGPMIVSVQTMLYKFTPRDSIATTQVTILIGAATTLVGSLFRRHHTDKAALLINYPLAATMVPAVMAGTLLGVILSEILPPLAAAVLMEATLLYSIASLCSKLKKEIAKEQNLEDQDTDVQLLPLQDKNSPSESPRRSATPFVRFRVVSSTPASTEPIKEPTILDLFCRQVPNILILLVALITVGTCAILRGGHGTPSIIGVPLCSAESWGILVLCLLCLSGLISAASTIDDNPFSYHKSLTSAIKRKLNVLRDKLPVNVKIVLVSFISGILAGTLGIGGGTITNPLLMEIGFDPQTSTALSKLAVFFSASGTVSQLAIGGSIKMKHAYHFGFLGLCGSLVGNFVLAELVARYKRPSLVIWALLLILGISMLLYPVHLYDAVQHKTWAAVLKWGSICYHS